MAAKLAKFFAGRAVGAVVASTVVGLLSTTIVYPTYRERKRNAAINGSFLRAVDPPPIWLVERPEVEKRIKSILQPEPTISGYGLISGSHGTGKTSAVLHAAN